MASAARSVTCIAARSAALKAPLRTSVAPSSRSLFLSQAARSSRRGYSSGPNPSSSGGSSLYWGLGAAAIAGAGGFYFYNSQNATLTQSSDGKSKGVFVPKQEDYQKVYNYIAKLLQEKDEYDDGSYGPVLVRLAWHCSGTYDKETGTGGSNGATMRFAPESDHGANAGLKAARDFIEPVKGMLSHIEQPSERAY
jgi:cytochrome c peroxidase